MRTRTALIVAMTTAALVISPLALADPLDPDPSFGGDGIVLIDRPQNFYEFGERDLATRGDRLFVVGAAPGSSGTWSSIHIEAHGRRGHDVAGSPTWARVQDRAPFASTQIVKTLTTSHRIYVVGWQAGGLDETRDTRVAPYGFVAAFRASLRKSVSWGTGRFTDPDKPGLERLREVDFGSVTGGAIDSQGRVLVTGRLHGQTAVLRLTRDGHIDRSYGNNGLATVSVGAISSPRGIAVHGTTALVAGNAKVNGHKQGFVTQITQYGYRDRTFSGDGIRLVGQPRSHATAVTTAENGRWLIAYESAKRAHVIKLGATGTLITHFGKAGHATAQCDRSHGRHVIDALTTDRKVGNLHRIALALSCERNGDLRRVAAIWRPGGQPINSLRPAATAPLPWQAATVDLAYGWAGRLVGLIPNKLIRLR